MLSVHARRAGAAIAGGWAVVREGEAGEALRIDDFGSGDTIEGGEATAGYGAWELLL